MRNVLNVGFILANRSTVDTRLWLQDLTLDLPADGGVWCDDAGQRFHSACYL